MADGADVKPRSWTSRRDEKAARAACSRARLAMATTEEAVGAGELAALLPWHATGALNQRTADEINRALAHSLQLACQMELIRQEQSETVRLNESLATPSARPMARLLAAIATEKAARGPTPTVLGLADRVRRR